ncbi:unnamed protein product [Somion occarium]|uniref:Pre-mRNA-splicing factor 38B n=1 Tax=Somion occarium TaxID=3059160 RepID=A0ABP1CGU9_9APHY
MSNTSLSSVVSNLVRASMGSSVSNNVTDDDLDRHIAELILKEAKQNAERYGTDGIRAYLPTNGGAESSAPRPNKRFLTSIIRSTDDHNKTILRAQALAAEEVRMERREQEKRERRARAEEAVEAERLRRLMGRSSRTIDNWRTGGKRDDKGKRRERSWERREEDVEEDESDYARDRERRKRDSERLERRHSHRHRHSHRSRSRSEERHDSRHSKHDRSRSPRHRSRSPDDKLRHSERRSRRHHHRTKDDRRSKSHDKTEGSLQEPSQSKIHPPSRQGTPAATQDALDTVSREQLLRDRLRLKSERQSPAAEQPLATEIPSRGRTQTRSQSPVRASSPEVGPFPVASSSARSPDSRLNPVPPTRSISRSPSPPPRRKHKRRRSRSLSPQSRKRPRSPSASPPPLPPIANPPSKMDKYFSPTYDPRLDVAALSTRVNVPKTGLITDDDFAGWDAMLELIRLKREDKEERKRLERLGITKEKSVKKKTEKAGSEGIDIMAIEYKKRGSVREWDLDISFIIHIHV